MSAPTALDNARTGTPDASNGIQIPTVVVQEGTLEAPCGISLSDRIASSLSPDRDNLTAHEAATVDMSTSGFAGTSGANLFAVNNRGAIVVWCTFEASTDSATVRLVYYDAADAPLFVGPALSFTPLAQRLSASGHYMSEPQIVESYGASQYRPYLAAKGDATNDVDIYSHPV